MNTYPTLLARMRRNRVVSDGTKWVEDVLTSTLATVILAPCCLPTEL